MEDNGYTIFKKSSGVPTMAIQRRHIRSVELGEKKLIITTVDGHVFINSSFDSNESAEKAFYKVVNPLGVPIK